MYEKRISEIKASWADPSCAAAAASTLATGAMASRQITLESGTAGISNLAFGPSGRSLLVSSWDSALRLYDVHANALQASYDVHSAPVLGCCFMDDGHGVSTSADGTVRVINVATGNDTSLATHSQPAQCVEYCAARSAVVSAGWDKLLILSDPRAPPLPRGSPANANNAMAELPDKAYTLALSDNRIVVGMAGRHIYVYDVRNLSEPEQRRESSLKYQTRCIRCTPDGQGFGVSSIEGRVAMEFFSESDATQQRYAFKCHRRQTGEGEDAVFPVNALAFHPSGGSFATGGGDGTVSVCDGQQRKRLQTFGPYSAGVASLAFSPAASSTAGATLAAALSYNFQNGDMHQDNKPEDQLLIWSVA
eukprot:COSAG05_NODE_482_length_9373_cov_198.471318_4_plen_363_part_00